MRVLICDDHRLFAEALAFVVGATGHDVVGCVSTPEAGADVARATEPDVCLLDLAFGDTVRFDGITLVKTASPRTAIVVLSGYADDDLAERVRWAGAAHCLSKDCDIERVARDLDRLCGARRSADARWDVRPADHWDAHPLARFLTPRERAVLEGLAEGESTERLAQRLSMRGATVRTHVQSILGKLGVHSRVEAVALAIADGLVTPSSPFDDRGYRALPGA